MCNGAEISPSVGVKNGTVQLVMRVTQEAKLGGVLVTVVEPVVRCRHAFDVLRHDGGATLIVAATRFL